MLKSSFRYCSHIKYTSPSVYSLGYTSSHFTRNNGSQRNQYSKSSKEMPPCSDCCKDVVQTKGKEVRVWPRPDSPSAAGSDCLADPQPTHYDPYKIKVPDIAVPPLPPSNARRIAVAWTTSERKDDGEPKAEQEHKPENQQSKKEEEDKDNSLLGLLKGLFGRNKKDKEDSEMQFEDGRELFRNAAVSLGMAHPPSNIHDLFQDSPIVHPDYWKHKPERKMPSSPSIDSGQKLGYHGRTKYLYAFHEPWKPLDRVALLQEADKEEADPPIDTTIGSLKY